MLFIELGQSVQSKEVNFLWMDVYVNTNFITFFSVSTYI